MFKITIPASEMYDEDMETFIDMPAVEVELEHSLVSLSKWESRFERPFLSDGPKPGHELMYYVYCMCLDSSVPYSTFLRLSRDNVKAINEYIALGMTATWFSEIPGSANGTNKEIITSEIMYYWLVAYNIPFEAASWNLKRMITLVRVCNEKNKPEKKMTKNETIQRMREANASRKQKLNTKG